MTLVLFAAASQQDPIWVYPVALGGLALIAFVLWLLDRIVAHFFPSTKNYHTSAGNALMRVEANFLPGGREHIVEACERDDAEEDDQGDPPETGLDRPSLSD